MSGVDAMSKEIQKQRIQIVSDLHLEFMYYEWDLPVTDADLIVIAGDVGVGTKHMEWMSQQIEIHKKPIIYVLGNHEFYHQDYDETILVWEKFSDSNKDFFLLHDRTAFINGVTYIGSTLWTDCENQESKEKLIEKHLNDFKVIRYHGRTLTAKDTTDMNEYAKDYIRFMLENLDHGTDKIVLVTHHAPSFKSSASLFDGSELNCAFASDMESILTGYGIDLAIHGHMHNFSDYMIGDTRVVANPKGYPRETDYGRGPFNASFIVEV